MYRFTAVCWLVGAFLLVVSGQAKADSITTTFASDNQFEGNMFNVTTFGNALNVTALEVNITPTVPFSINVYTKSGTFSGFEQTPSAWTLVASGSAISKGLNIPSFVDISDFVLPANSLTGMYITLSPAVGFGDTINMRYTDGNSTFSNSNIRLDLGVGVGGLFGANGGIFSPRTWNGAIFYDVQGAAVPEPASIALLGIGICGIALGALRRHRESARMGGRT